MRGVVTSARTARLVHWASALIIACLMLIGWVGFTGTAADYPAKSGLLMAHMGAGSLIALLTIMRVVLHFQRSRKRLAQSHDAIANNTPGLMHALQWTIYLLIAAMIGTGFATAVQSGLNLAVFGGSDTQLVPAWPTLTMLQLHGCVAIVLAVAIGAHGLSKRPLN